MYLDIVHNRMERHAESYHEQQEECVICLDEEEKEWRELVCHHRFHRQCIEDWIAIRAKCPMCMKNIKDNTIEEKNINNSLTEEIHNISIRRFLIFIFIIVCVIVVMVICSS